MRRGHVGGGRGGESGEARVARVQSGAVAVAGVELLLLLLLLDVLEDLDYGTMEKAGVGSIRALDGSGEIFVLTDLCDIDVVRPVVRRRGGAGDGGSPQGGGARTGKGGPKEKCKLSMFELDSCPFFLYLID